MRIVVNPEKIEKTSRIHFFFQIDFVCFLNKKLN